MNVVLMMVRRTPTRASFEARAALGSMFVHKQRCVTTGTRGLSMHATQRDRCVRTAARWPAPRAVQAGRCSSPARVASICSATSSRAPPSPTAQLPRQVQVLKVLPKQVPAPLQQALQQLTSQQSSVTEYLATLNDEQQAAVYCSTKDVRVKAGPGSGKTRVVTARVARLLRDGHDPSSILVITFTNKAADELKERISGVLGAQDGKRTVAAGTFHSTCCRILRAYVEQLPTYPVPPKEDPLEAWDRNFTVFDPDDALRAMKLALQGVLKVDSCDKHQNKLAKQLCDVYSDLRNKVPTIHYTTKLKELFDYPAWAKELSPLKEKDVLKCFTEYTRVCGENNAIDFDDLLGLTVALLQHRPDVRQELQAVWKHILVDEFQDTNSAQYELVRLLRGPEASSATTFVVGDSDQAIYSWRGAKPENMDKLFAKDFPGCETLYLSRNYRSGYDIIDAAEAVLSHGGLPPMHQMTRPMKQTPGRVEYARPFSERAEAVLVKDQIKAHHTSGGSYKDLAVSYRTRMQSRLFEEQLAIAGIPFRVLGDKPFWTRSEVKHMTSYLRLVANPAVDSMALEQIINVPARKLGAKSVAQMVKVAKQLGTGLAALLLGDLAKLPPLTLDELDPLLAELDRTDKLPAVALGLVADIGSALVKQHGLTLTKPARDGLQQLRAVLYLARSTAFHKPVPTVLQVLELASGYDEYVDGEPEKQEGLGILRKAAAAADTWCIREEDLVRHQERHAASPLEQLHLFLQHITLMRELDEVKDKSQDSNQVTLMTIHAAKGLEFHTVFFAGFVDGCVPLIREKDEILPPNDRHMGLMEEKRLAYVGCTRAMHNLYISAPMTRARFTAGGAMNMTTQQSRFLGQVFRTPVGSRVHKTKILPPPPKRDWHH